MAVGSVTRNTKKHIGVNAYGDGAIQDPRTILVSLLIMFIYWLFCDTNVTKHSNNKNVTLLHLQYTSTSHNVSNSSLPLVPFIWMNK